MGKRVKIQTFACLVLWLGACSAGGGDSMPGDEGPTDLLPSDNQPDSKRPEPAPVDRPISPVPDGGNGVKVLVPTDERPVLRADRPPPPLTGGTLLATKDGQRAIVADPDRDRVSIVKVTAPQALEHTIALEAGDEPGRLIEDDLGRVHVALRRGGAVVSIDPVAGTLLARRDVCEAPRGLAFVPETRTLRVACQDGELVSLPVDAGEVSERLPVAADLRDVVLAGSRTFVSRFKSAELIEISAGAAMPATRVPTQFVGSSDPSGARRIDAMAADVAWRTLLDPASGAMVMLHQGARLGEIELAHPEAADAEGEGEGGEGEGEGEGEGDAPAGDAPVMIPGGVVVPGPGGTGGSPYGGTGTDCSGVVQSEISTLGEDGSVRGTVRIPGVLPIDLALGSFNEMVVIQGGAADPQQPPRQVVFEGAGGTGPMSSAGFAPAGLPVAGPGFIGMGPAFGFQGEVMVFSRSDMDSLVVSSQSTGSEEPPCMFPHTTADITGQAVAAALVPNAQTLLVQSREPAMLVMGPTNGFFEQVVIDLGGESVYDTGHEIFHRNAGGGIACASCHAEGAEDGHTWVFSGFGPRRTQALHIGLEGTEPFHWQGDMPGISVLMEEVLVTRMGGVHQSDERVSALSQWLFTLPPPAPMRATDDAAAQRGHELFSGKAECATCHTGSKLTNNMTVDVGTGEPLQVPSLVGIAYRAPFVHDGCAETLRDRFDPSCGGTAHGNIAALSDTELDDLVAYLETL